ncbi:MAG: cyanoexosortase C, partial [Cyanobacteria bacterium J06555_13]
VYSWLQESIRTNHGRIVLIGLSIGLIYLPQWIGYFLPRITSGKIGWFLALSLLGMAGIEIWTKRRILKSMSASEEDRWLGYALIIAGVALFPFCRFALWSQAMIWLAILVGIATCTWGLRFFLKFAIPTFFISLTVYPRVGLISRNLWDFFTPPLFLEKAMSWATSTILINFGFQAQQSEQFILFPEGAVEIGWGCNGLDMAITVALAALLMGLFYKQNRYQMIWLITCAVVISLLANIPRLILVTLAYVYWGPGWFKFWHGFWGGQIFSGVLFTAYYYIALALINRHINQRHS